MLVRVLAPKLLLSLIAVGALSFVLYCGIRSHIQEEDSSLSSDRASETVSAKPITATEITPEPPLVEVLATAPMATELGNFERSTSARAYVQKVLANPTPEGIRFATRAEEFCREAMTFAKAVSAKRSRLPVEFAAAWEARQRKCSDGRQPDSGQSHTLSRMRRQLANTDALSAYQNRFDRTETQLLRIKRASDVEAAMAWGVGNAHDDSANLTSNEPDLRGVTSQLLELAWLAELCSRHECDEIPLRVSMCVLQDICEGSSYAEQVDILALRLNGGAEASWRATRSAMGRRVAAIFQGVNLH